MIESSGIRVKPEIGLLFDDIFGYKNFHGQTLGLNHCPSQYFSLFSGWMFVEMVSIGYLLFLMYSFTSHVHADTGLTRQWKFTPFINFDVDYLLWSVGR
jgi:hypothetical protein